MFIFNARNFRFNNVLFKAIHCFKTPEERAAEEAAAGGGSKTPEEIAEEEKKKKAEADAAAKNNAGSDDSAGSDEDDSKWDEKTKGQFKKLRDENKKHRLDGKATRDELDKLKNGLKSIFSGDGNDDSTPEQKLEAMQTSHDDLAFRTSVQDIALSNGLDKKGSKYLGFLIQEKMSELKENEELSEDEVSKLVIEAKGVGSKKTSNNSSVNDAGGNPPNPDGESDTTLEQFTAMGNQERSLLYNKNKALYDTLFKQAKEKKLL